MKGERDAEGQDLFVDVCPRHSQNISIFCFDQTRMWKYVWPFYAHAEHVYVSVAAQRGLIKFQLTKINALQTNRDEVYAMGGRSEGSFAMPKLPARWQQELKTTISWTQTINIILLDQEMYRISVPF